MVLATTLEDVLDLMEGCASRIDMYEIRQPDKYIVQFELIKKKEVYGMLESATDA